MNKRHIRNVKVHEYVLIDVIVRWTLIIYVINDTPHRRAHTVGGISHTYITNIANRNMKRRIIIFNYIISYK